MVRLPTNLSRIGGLRQRTIAGLAVAATVLVCAAPAQAGNLTVNTLSDHPPDPGGCNFPPDDCTLREALAEPVGIYGTQIRFTVTGTIQLANALNPITSSTFIQGPGADQLTVRGVTGGGTPFRVFEVASGDFAGISGLTIAGGEGTEGGGLYNAGTVNLDNAAVVGNTATGPGGGIRNISTGLLRINSSTISGNKTSGTPATTGGGGIANSGSLDLVNSTVANNHADGNGGGIDNYDLAGAIAVLSSATVTGNVAADSGGATDSGGINEAGAGSFFQVTNTLVAGNSVNRAGTVNPDCGSDGATDYTSGGHNLIGVQTSGCDWGISDTSTHISGVNANLGGLSSNGGPTATVPLLPGSPAIDRANPGVGLGQCGSIDQRGLPRNGRCDIGAFELQPPTPEPAAGGSPTAAAASVAPPPLCTKKKKKKKKRRSALAAKKRKKKKRC